MDDYTREMMDLKTLVTRTLEKRGVLARIRAELRANVFAAIEEEDRALENDENASFALLGSCNEPAKELHASPTGKLLTALICEYLEWGQLEHTLKVYLPECNLPRGFWKSELKEKLGQKADTGVSKDGKSSPLLLDILETYLKLEQNTSTLTGSFTKLGMRKASDSASCTVSDDLQAEIRLPSTSLTGSLPPLGRKLGLTSIGQTSSTSVRNFQVGMAADYSTPDANPPGRTLQ